MKIRNFSADDYPAFAELRNLAYPEAHRSAIELLMTDKSRAPQMISKRLVAESDGEIVGVAEFEHWEEFYHPRKYLLHVIVSPDRRRQGIGAALYERLSEAIQKRNPKILWAWTLEEETDGIEFLRRRDFAETMRARQLTLNVQKFDFEAYASAETALQNQGIEIKSFGEASGLPDGIAQLHRIYCDSVKSMDLPDKPTLPVLSTFTAWAEASPEVFAGHLVAVREGEIIGVCTLVSVGTVLYNEVTGVKDEYRNTGIAKILLAKAALRACENSLSGLTTYVRDHNRAMLALTEKLGFTKERGRILFRKSFAD